MPTGVPEAASDDARAQRRQSAPDHQRIPQAAVLGLQQHRRAVGGDAGRHPRALELQQRLEPEHLGLVGGERRQHPGQPGRLVGEVAAHPVLAGRGGVALVEDQVDHGHHVVEPRGALRAGRQLERRAGGGQGLLGPGDPLADRRLAGQEPARDLGGRQPADEAQRQRGPRLRGQRRVARQEDQAQDVVLDVVDLALEVGHVRLLSSGGALELGDLAAQVVGAPEVVDAAALGGRHQPGARVLGHAGDRPLLERGDQRVLGEVRRELDVAGHPGEGADEAGRVGPPRRMDGLAVLVCRHAASVVSPAQASGASGPPETWRRVATTVTSGQCSACSSANFCWSATASSTVAYSRSDQPPTTSLPSA